VAGGARTGQTVVASGEEIFTQRACNTCHRPDSQVRAPYLYGLLGKRCGSATRDRGGRRELHPRVDPQSQASGAASSR